MINRLFFTTSQGVTVVRAWRVINITERKEHEISNNKIINLRFRYCFENPSIRTQGIKMVYVSRLRTPNCMPTCITLIRLNPTDNESAARNVFLCCVRSNEEDRRGLRDDRPPICRGDVSIQREGWLWWWRHSRCRAYTLPLPPQHSLPDKILLETSPTPHPSGGDYWEINRSMISGSYYVKYENTVNNEIMSQTR